METEDRKQSRNTTETNHNTILYSPEHNGISLAQGAVDQHHVHSLAQTLDHLHLQHCALQALHIHQLVRQAALFVGIHSMHVIVNLLRKMKNKK